MWTDLLQLVCRLVTTCAFLRVYCNENYTCALRLVTSLHQVNSSLLRLDDNKSAASCQQAGCKLIVKTFYPQASCKLFQQLTPSLWCVWLCWPQYYFHQDNFYSRVKLQNISCHKQTFDSLVQTKQTPEQQEQLRNRLCNLTDEQYASFSREIQNQLNTTAVYTKVSSITFFRKVFWHYQPRD